jgi:hypothetical protein
MEYVKILKGCLDELDKKSGGSVTSDSLRYPDNNYGRFQRDELRSVLPMLEDMKGIVDGLLEDGVEPCRHTA